MLGERKVCGILTEVVADGREAVTIVGVGLNVNLDPVAAGLPDTATSLSAELGTDVSRGPLFSAIAARVDQQLRRAHAAPGDLLMCWEQLLWRRWQRVRIDADGQMLDAIVLGLSHTGALRVHDASGAVTEVVVGDVLDP